MRFPTRRIPRCARGGVLLAAALASLSMAWASPAPPVQANLTVDGALFNLLNLDRTRAGLAPLQWSPQLGGIAESAPYAGCGYTVAGRAQDMLQRNYFSHTIRDCGSQTVFNMMLANGISLGHAAENISFVSGLTGAGAIAQYLNTSFMKSPEHRGNILNPAYTQVGVGTAYGARWSGGCGGCQAATIGVEDFAAGRASAGQPPPGQPPPQADGTDPSGPVPAPAAAAAPVVPPPQAAVLSSSWLIHVRQPLMGVAAPSPPSAWKQLIHRQASQLWLPVGALVVAGGMAWLRLTGGSRGRRRAAATVRRGSG